MIATTEERFNWRLIVACWALIVVLAYLPLLAHSGAVPPFTDNDDSMRMVTASDLANGQGWQDTIEHRDNAPFGSPMHWSRLVDAPIAGLLLVLRPLLGMAAASNIAAFAWPPILLLGLLIVSVGLTRRLLGPGHQFSAVLLPALSIVVLGEFSPGRIDHHNVQMILTTGLVWATLAGRTSSPAALMAGLLAATSLAIGIETLPFIVGAVLAFSLYWVRDSAAAANARHFGFAFALGTLAHFVAATAPSLYFASACDALSDTYVVAAVLAAAAIATATLLGHGLNARRRLVLIGLLGILATAIVLALFPDCRGGPYGRLDARAYDLLIAHVPEAQPLWNWPGGGLIGAVSYTSICFVGLAVLVWRVAVTRGAQRVDWLVLLLYLALASAVMVLQVRGARLAVMPAIPAGAWLVARARAAYASKGKAWLGAGLVASWLMLAGVAQFAILTVVAGVTAGTPATASTLAVAPSATDCQLPAAFDRLASLPAGNVMGPTTLGSRILRYTGHAVVSAGYHRNVDGAIDVDDFLNAGEAAARGIAVRRDIRYVVACHGLAQLYPGAGSKPDSFVTLWNAGRHWDWLQPLSAPTDRLQIYEVAAAR